MKHQEISFTYINKYKNRINQVQVMPMSNMFSYDEAPLNKGSKLFTAWKFDKIYDNVLIWVWI